MEKFSLKKWESGNYDVVTRCGYSVRIICTDRIDEVYHIVGLVRLDEREYIRTYSYNGNISKDLQGYDYDLTGSDYDLFLVNKKWKPEHGNVMHFIDRTMNVDFMVYNMFNDEHIKLVNNGNCFETKEKAEEKLSKIKQALNNH